MTFLPARTKIFIEYGAWRHFVFLADWQANWVADENRPGAENAQNGHLGEAFGAPFSLLIGQIESDFFTIHSERCGSSRAVRACEECFSGKKSFN